MASMNLPPQPQPHPHPNQEYYKAFIPQIDKVSFNPLDPSKRYHVGVFIELHPTTQTGTMFHVTGDMIASSGMRYEEKEDKCLAKSEYLHAYDAIGYVRKEDYDSGRISETLKALPMPTKQQEINFWEDGEMYAVGEEQRRDFKCNEWTHGLAVPALREAGVLSL
ncbi:hypothetical protein BDV19DRAFT_380831 [Aspergillus venezuelensis]